MRKVLPSILFLFLLASSSIHPLQAAPDPKQSSTSSINLTLTSDPMALKESVRPGGTFLTFDTDLQLVGEPGAPALPVVSQLVGVPSVSPPAVAVTVGNAHPEKALDYPLEPVPTYRPVIEPESRDVLTEHLEAEYRIDTGIYSNQEWYPDNPVRVSDPMTLRGQAMVRVEFIPVQVNLATGAMRWLSSADITLSWDDVPLTAQAVPALDPHFESTFVGALSNYEQVRSWRSSDASVQRSSVGADEVRWIVALEGKGLFRISYEELAAVGIPLDHPDRLAVYYSSGATATEQAIWLHNTQDGFGPGDGLYLLNTRDAGRWSKNVFYHLKVLPSGAGLRMATLSAPPTQASTVNQVPFELRFEEDNVYMPRDTSTRPAERWIWKRFVVFSGLPLETLTAPFDLPHIAPGTGVVVTSELGPEHAPLDRCYLARVSVNDRQVERTWYDIHEPFGLQVDVPSNEIKGTGNIYQVEQEMCGGTSTLAFNGFSVHYQRKLVADGNQLLFVNDGAASRNFLVSGFTGPQIVAFDVSSTDTPKRMTDGATGGSGPYSLTFGRPATAQPEEYVVTTLGAAQAVESIKRYEDQGLRDDLSQTDYLIITHPDFRNAVEPLAAHHRSRGLTVRVVDTTAIYNDFGTGAMDPQALREFIRYAYQNWQRPSISYVLLVGDGTYDPLDILQTGEQVWLPPMLVYKDEFLGEAPSDNAFVAGLDVGDPEGASLPDVHIGRLPANSAVETASMVQKIVNYESAPSSLVNWRRNMLFVTDDAPDAAGDFYWLSDHLTNDVPGGLDLIPPQINVLKGYLRQPGAYFANELDVRDAIATSMNRGLLLIQYIGHGSRTQWAGSGGIWSLVRPGGSDLSLLVPNDRLPFSLPWTCWEGYFIEPGQPGMSESMMRLPERGIIGSFAPTGLDVATGHDLMAQAFYRALFGENPDTQLGPLTLRTKLALSSYSNYERLVWTYMLYGDPATSLNVDPCLHDSSLACSADRTIYYPVSTLMGP